MPVESPREGRADRARFERTVLPLTHGLKGTALRLSRNRAEAEDLVQETVLKAWRFWPRYSEEDNCRAWLHRILTNTFLSQRRRVARERDLLARLEEGHDLARASTAPEPEAAFDSTLDDELSAGLRALRDEQRQVLWLVDVEERSYREAALALDCPLGTVMSRLHRGRGALRAYLAALAGQAAAVTHA